ncbi:hypothetical protein DIPPA_06809 [Diplonema papillatum]|nr:hypothetical protein DIPPA_06809 [Diplonema papillatum]
MWAMQQVGNGQQLAAVETQVRRDLDTTLKRYEAQLAAVAEEASAERAAIEQQASERVQQALRDRDAVAEEYASFRAQVVATESELRLREAALQIVIGKMEARLGEAELRYIIAEERAEEAEIRVLEYQEQQEQQEEDQQQQQQQQQEQKQQQQQQQEPQREQQRQQQPERSRSRSRSRSVGSSLDVRAAEACRVERGPRASGASADRRGEGADPPSEQQPSSWSASAAHASQSCAWGSFLLAITLCCAFVVIELATSAEVVSPILPYCQEAATNVRYAWNHRLWPVNVEVALLATLLLFLGGVPIGRSVRQTSVALLLLAVAFALTTLLIDSTTEASITPSIIASCKKRLPELREDLQIYADRRVAALVSCRESAERALAASWDLLAVSVEAAGKVAGDCLRQLRGAADRVVACFSSSPAGLSDDEAPAVVDEYCEE